MKNYVEITRFPEINFNNSNMAVINNHVFDMDFDGDIPFDKTIRFNKVYSLAMCDRCFSLCNSIRKAKIEKDRPHDKDPNSYREMTDEEYDEMC